MGLFIKIDVACHSQQPLWGFDHLKGFSSFLPQKALESQGRVSRCHLKGIEITSTITAQLVDEVKDLLPGKEETAGYWLLLHSLVHQKWHGYPKCLNVFRLRLRRREGYLCLPLLSHILLLFLTSAMRQRKEIKDMQIRSEEIKLFLLIVTMIIHVGNPRDCIFKKLSQN